MTDFAANIIAALSASSGERATTAKMIASEVDSNRDGKLTGDEFQKVFAVLQRNEQLMGHQGSGQSSGFTSAGVRPTIFDCTLYPSFSKNYALSQYQAAEMFASFDKNSDKVITLDELSGAAVPSPTTPVTPVTPDPVTKTTTDGSTTGTTTTDPATDPNTTDPAPAPQTPAERADALMAQYDTTNKGYVTLEDIAGAWIKDPTLGDISQLANVVQAWDANGDGRIMRDEIVSVFTIMDTADAMLAQMGETAQNALSGTDPTITLANVTDAQLTQIDISRNTLTSWDTDKNGALTRTELIDGLRAVSQQTAPTPTAADYAQAMLTSFDTDKNSVLSLDEFEQAVATDMDASAAQASFNAWDANQDGSISLGELISGVDAAQRATQIMASYDLTNKGYFDIADLQRELDASPDASSRASAADIMAVWDLDGDGHVTTQEVVNQLLLQKVAQPSVATGTADTTLPTG